MDNISYKVWTGFYQEFANKLLNFKDNRGALIEIIKQVYMNTNIKLPTLEKDNKIVDIDPFTVYGLFNKDITNQNRTTIIGAFAKLLDIPLQVPTVFDGVPVLNNMSATFYWFEGDRGSHDIQNLWDVFECAINYAEDPNDDYRNLLVNHFDIASSQKGVKWNLTIGFYWIRPYAYINLDGFNRAFLSNKDSGMNEVLSIFPELAKDYFPSGEQYIVISENCKTLIETGEFKFKNFPELSHHSCESKFEISNDEKSENLSKSHFLKWFAPLIKALNDLGGSATRKEACEKIAENENLDESTLTETRGKHNVNKFDNEVAWARNYLVYANIIDKSQRGIWKLTDFGKTVTMTNELASKILREYRQNPSENPTESIVKKKYWLFAPGQNASQWGNFYDSGIIGIGWDNLGCITQYASKEDVKSSMRELSGEDKSFKNDGLALWQFANDISVGDVIIAKQGYSMVLGRGIVETDYIFDDSRAEYKHIRRVNWTHKGEWEHPGQAVQKTLTDITQYTEYVEKLEMLFLNGAETIADKEVVVYPIYTKENFLSQVYMSKENYNTIKNLLLRKKMSFCRVLLVLGKPLQLRGSHTLL